MDETGLEGDSSFHFSRGDSIGVVVEDTLLDLVHRVQGGDRVDH
jgi:hypothetical protein